MFNKSIICYVFFLSLSAHAINVEFFKMGQSDGQTWINKIAVDSHGALYIIGDFYKSFKIDNTTLSCDNVDVFYARLNSKGEIQKINKTGASSQGGRIAIDPLGNAFISGVYSGSFIFGSSNFSSSEGDIWIAKCDSLLNPLWAIQSQSKPGSFSYLNDIMTDAWGDLYVIGTFNDTIIFAKDTLKNPYKMKNSQFRSGFLTKCDKNGSILWSKHISLKGSQFCSSICQDNESNLYVFGSYWNARIGLLGSDTIIYNDPWQLSIDKYDSYGNHLQRRAFNFGNEYIANSICYDTASNSLYMTGYSSDTLSNSKQSEHVFISRLSKDLDTVWTRQTKGNSQVASGNSIVAQNGKLFLTGRFSDSTQFSSITLYTKSWMDFFVSEWDQSGNITWILTNKHSSSSREKAIGNSIVLDSNTVYVGGEFEDTLVINKDSLLNSTSNSYMFLLKLNDINSAITNHQINKIPNLQTTKQNYASQVNAMGRKYFIQTPHNSFAPCVLYFKSTNRTTSKVFSNRIDGKTMNNIKTQLGK